MGIADDYASKLCNHCGSSNCHGECIIFGMKARIALQDELLRQAKEVVKRYRNLKNDPASIGCMCERCQELETQSKNLLTLLKAAMEERKPQ